jgi:hypothetical protein
MNFVKLIFNESDKQFGIEKNDEIYPAPIETEIQAAINITDSNFFKNLIFGINVIKGSSTLFSGRFPPIGVNIEYCDTAPLLTTRVAFEKESTYFLEFWIESLNDTFKNTYEITIDKPAKPYASWVWNGTDWQAPIATPDGDRKWDEETLSWKILS